MWIERVREVLGKLKKATAGARYVGDGLPTRNQPTAMGRAAVKTRATARTVEYFYVPKPNNKKFLGCHQVYR